MSYRCCLDWLCSVGFLTDDLAFGKVKYMGVCALTAAARQAARAPLSSDVTEPSASAVSPAKAAAHARPRAVIHVPTLDEIDEDDSSRALHVGLPRVPTVRESVRASVPSGRAVDGSAEEYVDRSSVGSGAGSGADHRPVHRRIDIRFFPHNCYWVGTSMHVCMPRCVVHAIFVLTCET